MHCSTFLSRPLEHGNCTAALDELPVFEVFFLLFDVKLCWEISATHPCRPSRSACPRDLRRRLSHMLVETLDEGFLAKIRGIEVPGGLFFGSQAALQYRSRAGLTLLTAILCSSANEN